MLKSGILNPQLNALLARFRHTNTIVIADRGFPFWPQVETLDLALVDGIPTVHDILRAILPIVTVGPIFMAEEFRNANPEAAYAALTQLTGDRPITWEPHVVFKRRIPSVIGLIRTGDTTQYANMVLESA
jgi:D-ribose pyranase